MIDETLETLGDFADDVADAAVDAGQAVADAATDAVSVAAGRISDVARAEARRSILVPAISVALIVVGVLLVIGLRRRSERTEAEQPSADHRER